MPLTTSFVSRCITMGVLSFTVAGCQNLVLRPADPTPEPQIAIEYDNLFRTDGPSVAAVGYRDYFTDQRLIQVIDLALANNRDLRAAVLNIEKTQQQYRISANEQLPTVGASGGISREQILLRNDPTTSYNVGLGVTSYELDFFGRVKNLKEAALENFLATQDARDATQVSLVGEIAQAWYLYGYYQANAKLAAQTLKSQREVYRINKKRFEVGIDSEVSVRQAQISVETALADLANFKSQIQVAKNTLTLLVGQPVDNHLLLTDLPKSATNQRLTTGLPSDLLNNRPDLIAAERQLRAAGANVGVAKAQLYPSITLTGSAGLASTSLSDLFKSGAFIWKIGPSIDMPIFDSGTRKANVRVSEVDQRIALNDYEKSIQVAFKEVNDVLAVRNFIGDRLAAQRRLIKATQTNYRLSQARFRAGIDNYITVLDAQRGLYGSQQALLSLEQADLNSQIELYKALGGGVR